jgi:acetylornithine/N-succinyldiaminopimelate aminotransferase
MSTSHAFAAPAGSVDTGGADHCPFMPVFGPPQVMFVRGDGTQLWDSEGRRYLDFLAGIAVVSLGHANPVVAEAICRQASTLLHVSNFFANPVATQAAQRINARLAAATGAAGQVFFCNSGAEANECAFKLARKWGGRGRHGVVSAFGSFHGRTLAALAATGQPAKWEAFQPMPDGFRHVAFGDLDALAGAVDPTVAAVVLEAVQGEGGVVPADPGYLRAVRELCDERGLLLILDEVQTGLGRTGTWFGFEHAGIAPDVVTLAKALGNGMPVGACWARTDVAAAFRPGDHGSTYSGTAIATAAVLAVLDEMERLDAPALARTQGQRLRDALAAVPGVASVRGLGLLLGAVLDDGIEAKAVTDACLRRGLVANAVAAGVVRFAPPLTVSDAEIDEAVAIFAAACAEVIGAGSGSAAPAPAPGGRP